MKKLIKIAIMMLIVSILLKVEKELKENDVFKIKNIEIVNSGIMLEDEIKKLKKLILGKNIHNLEIDKIQELYKQDIRIEQFIIKKAGINSLKIKILEKKAKYYGHYGERLYILDEEGNSIAELKESTKELLPIVSFKNEDEKTELLEVVDKFSELDNLVDISQIYKVNSDMILIILRDGVRLKTNVAVEKEKYKIAINLYNSLIKEKKLEYIDVRFKDIIIKEEGDAG